MQIIRNETNQVEANLYTGEVTAHELTQIDARTNDTLTIYDVMTETVQQGHYRTSGGNEMKPRMIVREVSRQAVKAGTMKRNGVKWN